MIIRGYGGACRERCDEDDESFESFHHGLSTSDPPSLVRRSFAAAAFGSISEPRPCMWRAIGQALTAELLFLRPGIAARPYPSPLENHGTPRLYDRADAAFEERLLRIIDLDVVEF